ncbi:AbrB/MazE/SpoVT family DNA-binding domain-containing protein [Candidatus Woesearchaeota archaeon]|nr:AbrB/MazE/SpoVT family DNA-binding domain-containing protein [Candidatus Woesearchaeota archaeon]
MKQYPKIVQIDKRGQIVIPKDIRAELDIDEGTGFWVYSIEDEGILLKKVEAEPLEKHEKILSKLEEKAPKLKIRKENIAKAVKKYKRTKKGKLDVI